MHARGRGEGALRRYRVSLSETSYFLTLCTAERVDGLTREESARAIRAEIAALETAGHWIQRAGVLMPDHLHLLVRLTGDLPVERCVARLKAMTCPALVVHNLAWQPNFYDHRLRPGDSVEEVLRYMFLNPYRSSLIPKKALYSWFWLGAEEKVWFEPCTDNGLPFPEWLR